MKKKKFPAFLVCYLFFLLASIAVWIYVISYVYDCLVQYEAAQPEHVIEQLTEKILNDGVGSVFRPEITTTRFEDSDSIADQYLRKMEGKTITWRQDKTSYNTSAPVYRFYADEEPIGVVVLREVSTRPLMFILSLADWEIDSTEAFFEEAGEEISITVPETCSVRLNGVDLGAGEYFGQKEISDIFQYAKDYVAVPGLVEYRVEGLYEKPEVEIRDADGNKLAFEETSEAGHTEIVMDTFPVSEMDPELEKMAIENAKRYSNFFSRDLPGCEASTKPIADMFPKDSYYLELAETYRREDMWMYSSHSAPSFAEEKVSNYTRYSDELFSCEVYFEKHLYLVKVNQERTDITHTRFFYCLLDDKWKIVDMQTLLE